MASSEMEKRKISDQPYHRTEIDHVAEFDENKKARETKETSRQEKGSIGAFNSMKHTIY